MIRPPTARRRLPYACGVSHLHVDILDGTPGKRLDASDIHFLSKHLQRAGELLRAAGELRVRLVCDPEMADAHQRFSGVAGTTDVLTFDLSDAAAPEPGSRPSIPLDICLNFDRIVYTIDVDLLVCVDEAERQATPRGYPWRQEALLYSVHGLLHCLGHDDHDDAGYQAMHTLEDRILEALGVEARFGPDRPD